MHDHDHFLSDGRKGAVTGGGEGCTVYNVQLVVRLIENPAGGGGKGTTA
jgi:hypothetical protein